MTFNDLCLLITCEKCRVPSGEWCRTKTGRRASYVHRARSWAVQQVWHDGFTEGQRDVVGALDSGSEWSVRYIARVRTEMAS